MLLFIFFFFFFFFFCVNVFCFLLRVKNKREEMMIKNAETVT